MGPALSFCTGPCATRRMVAGEYGITLLPEVLLPLEVRDRRIVETAKAGWAMCVSTRRG